MRATSVLVHLPLGKTAAKIPFDMMATKKIRATPGELIHAGTSDAG
jgi:hypothetical protein